MKALVVMESKIKAPSIMNDSYPAAFALKHLVKDLLAKDAGLSSPLIHPLYSSYLNAQEEA
jgi:3-hydroxyisobutyrate dehydrogenase